MERTFYCLMYDEVRLKPCPFPPTKEVLIRKIREIEQMKEVDFGIKDSAVPDKQWLIMVLSSLKPDDEIFSKNYLPPTRPKKDRVINTI